MKVRFKNPPINELVIGAYFHPPLIQLRSEHIGLLWSRLRTEFPKVEQQQPLAINIPGLGPSVPMGEEFLLMPRFWFVSKDEINVIQVQRNAFLVNWRKRKTEYPSFNNQLKPGFDRYFSVFKEFVREDVEISDFKVGSFELTYVNVIDVCEYWQGPQDTPKLVPSFCIPESGYSRESALAFHCAYGHSIEDNLQLHTILRTAEASGDPASPCLILELKARGHPLGVAKSDVDAWYDQAHDALVARFLRVTDEHVQRAYWMREDETE